MISFVLAKTLFGGKLWYLSVWMVTCLAAAITEAFLGQMVIALVVALIGATPPTVAIILTARKQSDERRIAQDVLLQNQKTMAENLDGKLDRLSRAENAQAKAEGIIEGGEKEQARVAVVPVVTVPAQIEIVNPPNRPVPTVPGIKEK